MARNFKTGILITGDAKGAVSAMKVTREELDKMNVGLARADKTGREFSRTAYRMRGAISAIISGATIAQAVRYADTYNDLEARVRIATGSAEEFESAQRAIFEISQDTSTALESTTELFSRLSLSLKDAGTSQQDLLRVTETINKAMIVSGASAQEASNAIVQLAQGLAAGALRGDEFRSVAEQSPRILAALQASLGKTRGELKALADQGLLTTEVVTAALLEQSQAIQQEFEEVPITVGRAFTQLRNETLRSIGELDNATGASNKLASSIVFLAENVEVLGRALAGLAAGSMAVYVSRAIAAGTATTTLATAFRFALGPIGLIATAIGTLTFAMLSFKDSAEKAQEAATQAIQRIRAALDQGAVVEELRAAQDEFNRLGEVIEQKRAVVRGFQDDFENLSAVRALEAEIERLEAAQASSQEVIDAAAQRLAEFKAATGDAADGAGELTSALDLLNNATRGTEVVSLATLWFKQFEAQVKKAGQEARRQAAEFQSLVDRLDPVAAAARRFESEQAILTARLDAGGLSAEQYRVYMERLRGEYAAQVRDLAGVEDQVEKTAQGFDAFTEVARRGAERLDDVFSGLWANLFDGATDVLDDLRQFFRRWLAEMAHAALTRPIVVSIVTSLFGAGAAQAAGLSSSGAAAGQRGVFDAIFGQLGGGGSSGLLGGIGRYLAGGGGFLDNILTSIFGGAGSFGPGGTGFFTSLTTPFASGSAFGAGLLGNLGALGAAGPYALIGSLLGGVLGQNPVTTGAGAGIGAALGTLTPLGPLGTILGGLLGGAFGSLFGDDEPDPRIQLVGSNVIGNPVLQGRTGPFYDTSLGGFNITNANDLAEGTVDSVVDAIREFDSAIAGFLDADRLDQATSVLRDWGKEFEGEGITIAEILESRFNQLLYAFEDNIDAFVNQADTLEERVERLQGALAIDQIIQETELLAGRTLAEVGAVVEAMREEGEAFGDVLRRFLAEFQEAAGLLEGLRAFVSSSAAADFATLTAQEQRTALQTAQSYGAEILALRDSFDGSLDAVRQLASLSRGYYEQELVFAAQIAQVRDQAIAGFASLRERIERITLGDEAFYETLRQRARGLAEQLATMTDPAQISATLGQIQGLTDQAFGLLSPEQQSALGGEYLSFIDQVNALVEQRLAVSESAFAEEGEGIRGAVDSLLEGIVDPLSLVAASHEGAAEALTEAAAALVGAAGALYPGRGEDGLPPGAASPVAPIGSGSAYDATTEAVNAAARSAERISVTVANTTADAIVAAVSQQAAQIRAALQQAVGSITIQIENPYALVNE